ncbi:MAG: C40 family peptidase [Thermoclostridium sp.]|nr:C40 family peptidase [Thermoclostridium sp.]
MKKLISAFAVIIFTTIMMPNIAQADYYTEQKTLYYGMRSYEVQNLQKDLQYLGYFTQPTTTTYFGSITQYAVRAFQYNNGLFIDGIVGPQTSRMIKAKKVVKAAKGYTGVPYVWGGSSPNGFDCSGFTSYVMSGNGITIPRVSADQYNFGMWVNKSQLQPGDLVFFTTYQSGPSHVGIYLGNGQFIHASSGAGKITISLLSNPYYSQRYLGARRVI